MECPNCLTKYFPQFTFTDISTHSQPQNRHFMIYQVCPDCDKYIMYLKMNSTANEIRQFIQDRKNLDLSAFGAELILPKIKKQKPFPKEIPLDFAQEYYKANEVLMISTKASAALSRHCLQRLLIEKGKVTKRDLVEQIQEVLDSNQLPSHLADDIDAIRNIGNFATHPIKSTNSGTIVEVENGEAEWTLEVLEGLFDFYFVSPEKSKQRKNALNKKLQQAGKPQMK